MTWSDEALALGDGSPAVGGWSNDATGHRATNCDCDECGNPDMSNSPSDTLCLLCVTQTVRSEAQFCADIEDA